LFGKRRIGFSVGVAPLGSVTESYLQSADPVATLQCQWQMAEGWHRDSLLPTSSVNERTEQRSCRLQRAVSVLATVACGRLCSGRVNTDRIVLSCGIHNCVKCVKWILFVLRTSNAHR